MHFPLTHTHEVQCQCAWGQCQCWHIHICLHHCCNHQLLRAAESMPYSRLHLDCCYPGQVVQLTSLCFSFTIYNTGIIILQDNVWGKNASPLHSERQTASYHYCLLIVMTPYMDTGISTSAHRTQNLHSHFLINPDRNSEAPLETARLQT